MKKLYQNLLIGLAAAIILGLIVYLENDKGVEVATDKTDYTVGTALMVNIKNGTNADICFSGCYPYYLEVLNSDWTTYEYGDCLETDKIAKCLPQNEVKTFKIVLSQAEPGFHRIKIPACVGCAVGQEFKADKTFYSNSFKIE